FRCRCKIRVRLVQCRVRAECRFWPGQFRYETTRKAIWYHSFELGPNSGIGVLWLRHKLEIRGLSSDRSKHQLPVCQIERRKGLFSVRKFDEIGESVPIWY
ncbi:hypothetical protein OXX79_013939, partial [Metschnikowia pulcherrima]